VLPNFQGITTPTSSGNGTTIINVQAPASCTQCAPASPA
jgi:hypothetical protein